MRKLRAAIIGTGFMGRMHAESIRRLGGVDIRAICDSRLEPARKLAEEFGAERAESDFQKILQDPEVDTVHICTPNSLHFPMASAALAAGKHVLCEKPLATSANEARQLVDLAARSNLRHCTNHNLRFYPMVQQMRRMCEDGDLGEILIVQGTYSQDWLLYDTDWNWRIVSKEGGPSRTLADIGSHWCDMAEHITGRRITSLCADLQTFHKTRKQPKGPVETFAGKTLKPEDYTETPVDTEDFASVLFHMGNRTRGAYTVSQVSAGRKNRLSIEVFGSKSSVAWDAERPDELWIGNRNTNSQILLKDPALMKPEARSYADLPGGHSEGYDDTFKQIFRRFYHSIADASAAPEYPRFEDGLRQLIILEAELASHRRRAWVEV
jgi:predicted dehydrogenase